MKETGLNGYAYDFNIDYDTIAIDDILGIHKYLMEKNKMKRCLDLLNHLLKHLFIGFMFFQAITFLATTY